MKIACCVAETSTQCLSIKGFITFFLRYPFAVSPESQRLHPVAKFDRYLIFPPHCCFQLPLHVYYVSYSVVSGRSVVDSIDAIDGRRYRCHASATAPVPPLNCIEPPPMYPSRHQPDVTKVTKAAELRVLPTSLFLFHAILVL